MRQFLRIFCAFYDRMHSLDLRSPNGIWGQVPQLQMSGGIFYEPVILCDILHVSVHFYV